MLIDRLRRAAGGATAGEDLSAGILENLCFKAKDLSSAAARGCQLSVARVINYEEVVHLWSERERIDNKKAAGAAASEKKSRELQKTSDQNQVREEGQLKLLA